MSVAIPEKTSEAQGKPTTEGAKLSHIAILIAVGIFATGLAQPQILGALFFANLVKGELHASKTMYSTFFFLCAFPWYLKPLAGLLSDAFPLLGTKRRNYMLASAVSATISWIVLAFVPHRYGAVLASCIVVNFFLMIGSTVTGGILVEAGRSLQATGRLASLRVVVQNLIGIAQGPLGGLLATTGIAVLAGVSATTIATLIPVSYVLLKERPEAVKNRRAFREAGTQLKSLISTRSLLLAIVVMAFFYFAPGFVDVLYYRQTDLFGLSPQRIGFLWGISASLGFATAIGYTIACRKWNLGRLILVAILLNAAGNFLYLFYSKSFAIDAVIEAQNGISFALCELALYDLAARVVPVGCEAMGYGLLIATQSLFFKGAGLIGSVLSDHHVEFWKLLALNSGMTLCVLLIIPFLPQAIKAATDQRNTARA